MEVQVLRDELGQEDVAGSVADGSADITVQSNDLRGRLPVEQVTLEALQTALDEIRLLYQNARDLGLGVALAAPGTALRRPRVPSRVRTPGPPAVGQLHPRQGFTTGSALDLRAYCPVQGLLVRGRRAIPGGHRNQ